MGSPGDRSLLERFEGWAQDRPEQIAIKDQERAITYGELNDMATMLASTIRAKSQNTGEPVVVFSANDITRAVGLLGVLKVGKTFVPLDPHLPEARTVGILETLQQGLILVDEESTLLATRLAGDKYVLQRIDEIGSANLEVRKNATSSPDSLIWIIFTSGSTGQPKGVTQNYRNASYYVEGLESLNLKPDDRWAFTSPLTIHSGIVWTLTALRCGVSLYPINLKSMPLDDLVQWLKVEHITIFSTVPTILRRLANHLFAPEELVNVRLLRLTGESVVKRDFELYREYFGEQCALSVGFGTTETGGIRQAHFTKESEIRGERVPVGYAVEGVDVMLLDEEDREVGPDQPGEIVVVSHYLSPGYWERPDLTETVFSMMPNGQRMYRTGDFGILRPDGSLEHLGRKDLQLQIHGQRVEIEEIETALLGIPYVKEAAVVARQDNEGHLQLVAHLVLHKQYRAQRTEIRRQLTRLLPVTMMPFRIIVEDKLPLTQSGKVDRQVLSRTDLSNYGRETPFVLPKTPIEVALTDIWTDVLEIEQVGILDNFLELGGDSLSATRVLSRIFDIFEVKIPITSMFDGPTIRELALKITGRLAAREREDQ